VIKQLARTGLEIEEDAVNSACGDRRIDRQTPRANLLLTRDDASLKPKVLKMKAHRKMMQLGIVKN
jgi:hypothetical protein